MQPIELRARREALGMTQSDLARALGVSQSSVAHWERGTRTIPAGIAGELDDLEGTVDDIVDNALTVIEATIAAGAEPALITYATDAELWSQLPELDGLPASSHRTAIARARSVSEAAVPIIAWPAPK